MIVHSAILTDTEVSCRLNCVNVGAEEQKLPAVLFLLTLDHFLDLIAVIPAACILHSVSRDDEHRMLRHILSSCILMDISDVVDCSADSIQKGGAAPHRVVLIGHRLDVLDAHTVMNNLAGVVEENSGDESFALSLFLFLDHGVEASDGVSLKPTHRAAAVKNEYDLRQVLSHVQYLRI